MATDDHPNQIGGNARLNLGAKLAARIEQADDVDVFQLSLVAGHAVCIEAWRTPASGGGGLADPYLRLYDATGRLVAWDDQAQGSGNARINLVVPATGTYYVAVDDAAAGTGAYELGAYRRNVVPSSNLSDLTSGTAAPDSMLMGRGRDSFSGGSGDDHLDGGDDLDTVTCSGPAGRYSLERVPLGSWAGGATAGWVLRDHVGSEGNDILVNVERIRFADTRWALDLDGAAGFTVRLIGALFGKDAVQNRAYVGVGLAQLDAGASTESLITLALQARLGPQPRDADLVTVLYTNLVGVAPGASELATYTALLANGTYTQASLVGMAAEQPANLANIGFADLLAHGVGYG